MNDELKKTSYLKKFLLIISIVTIIICIRLLFLFWPRLYIDKVPSKENICRNNLKFLGLAFYMYAQDNSNSFPTSNKWCDLIKPYTKDSSEKVFQCPTAEKARCHYAMNPNCEPNSPPDTVLLFETKGGWNLFGGPELLTTDNHSNYICNVCYKDGSVSRLRKQEIANLNWSAEGKNE